MIVFRHVDPRFPFLREASGQSEGRWNRAGAGPVQYLAGTPDGAWAELLRHEEITEAADLPGIERTLWAIELPVPPVVEAALDRTVLRGGHASWAACQAEAERLTGTGVSSIVAPSAALEDGPSGWRTEGGLRPGPDRAERVFVLFGARPDLVAWRACDRGRPGQELLPRVRPLEAG